VTVGYNDNPGSQSGTMHFERICFDGLEMRPRLLNDIHAGTVDELSALPCGRGDRHTHWSSDQVIFISGHEVFFFLELSTHCSVA
jgi:hypothetical protein